MTQEGQFSIAVRLLLTAEQRSRLFLLCQRENTDVTDVLTKIIGNHLDSLNELTPPTPTIQAPPPDNQRALRRQLIQLRTQASQYGTEPPEWLQGYIADLEQQLASSRNRSVENE